MIVGCIKVHGEAVDPAIIGINKLRPYTERYVIIVDETVTKKQIKKLEDLGEVYFHSFEDDFITFRNQYLQKCQRDDWVITHDPDEFFNDQFCQDIHQICEEAGETDLFLVNSHVIFHCQDGSTEEHASLFFKPLVFRNREGTHYGGDGSSPKKIHESLVILGLRGEMKLPANKYWYDHARYWHEVWERAGRNVWICGGGINLGKANPSWVPLREICESLGLDTWHKTRDYFRKGNIDPRLKEWLWNNRFAGFQHEIEMMEFGRWYFEYLHPEEATFPDGRLWKAETELKEGLPAEVSWYVEQCYRKILGRHSDREGKEHYTKQILDSHINREDLPKILGESEEYKEKGVSPKNVG